LKANTYEYQTPQYSGIRIEGATSIDIVNFSKEMNDYIWKKQALSKHQLVKDLVNI